MIEEQNKKKLWFTSDLHFNHHNIIQYCKRGIGIYDEELKPNANELFRDTDQMNKILVKRWNARVGLNDDVYLLGDFAMGRPEEWPTFAQQLQGNITLVAGNHDKDKKSQIRNSIYQCGFKEVVEELYLDYNGIILWMAHFPYGEIDERRGYERVKATRDWDIALSGHVHDAWFVNAKNTINVGVDVNDLEPKTLEELIEKAKEFDSFKPVYEKIESKLTILKI